MGWSPLGAGPGAPDTGSGLIGGEVFVLLLTPVGGEVLGVVPLSVDVDGEPP